jgi:hypothetical protein
MKIINHVAHWNYRELAVFFSAVLAADKGIASQIEDFGAALLVVADDGKAVVFTNG